MDKTAVFVPAYCLRRNELSLTAMSEQATRIAAQLVKENAASHIILSTAYKTWYMEKSLKIEVLGKCNPQYNLEGNPLRKAIRVIPQVTDNYDEAQKTKAVLEELGAARLIVVADKWHLPRALKAFKAFLPEISVIGFHFTTPKYEMTLEPSRIKSIRAGYAPLWILWNIAFDILTPLMLRWQKKRTAAH